MNIILYFEKKIKSTKKTTYITQGSNKGLCSNLHFSIYIVEFHFVATTTSTPTTSSTTYPTTPWYYKSKHIFFNLITKIQ